MNVEQDRKYPQAATFYVYIIHICSSTKVSVFYSALSCHLTPNPTTYTCTSTTKRAFVAGFVVHVPQQGRAGFSLFHLTKRKEDEKGRIDTETEIRIYSFCISYIPEANYILPTDSFQLPLHSVEKIK